jgi:hypothetical protein
MQNAIQNSCTQPISGICVISGCREIPSTKYNLFEKTNPIFKEES